MASTLGNDGDSTEVKTLMANELQMDETAGLRPRLSFQPDENGNSQGMTVVQMKHREVQSQIDSLHENTRDMLWRQQQDLTRSFRAQIQDMHEALSLERDRNDKGSASWVMKCEKYKKELDWLRSLTDKLTTENKIFIRENRRFQQQLNTIEQDKSFLMKQLVIAKKENARLRLMLEKASIDVPTSTIATALPDDSTAQSGQALLNQTIARHPLAVTTIPQGLQRAATARSATSSKPSHTLENLSISARDGPLSARTSRSTTAAKNLESSVTPQPDDNLRQQYEAALNTISQLRRDLKRMETKCRTAETRVADELSSRSQLLDLVKIGVEELRQEILARKAEHARLLAKRAGVPASRLASTLTAAALSGTGARAGSVNLAATSPILQHDPREIGLDQFTLADRARLVEWLVSQDIVIYALYELLFPVSDRGSGLGIDGLPDKGFGLSFTANTSSTGRIQRAVDNAVAIAQAHAQHAASQPQLTQQIQAAVRPQQQSMLADSIISQPKKQLQGREITGIMNDKLTSTQELTTNAMSIRSSDSPQPGLGSLSGQTRLRLRPASSTKPSLVPNQAELNERATVSAWSQE